MRGQNMPDRLETDALQATMAPTGLCCEQVRPFGLAPMHAYVQQPHLAEKRKLLSL